jgi:hypothetical protein
VCAGTSFRTVGVAVPIPARVKIFEAGFSRIR